ncbi:MAG: hypothetical protein WC455_02695 [Dehalococcoidia bacterium]|jgi:hypothetical protein
MSAQKKRFHTRVISAIVILIAITLVMIPSVEDEGIVYGYGGGGGGGGGAPANDNWTVCADGSCDRGDVNFWGTTLDTFWAVSDDITIHIPKFTKMKGPEGSRLLSLGADKIDPPPAPDGYQVLAAFEFDPSGATFDPGITINIKFDPEDVPAGKTPVIAYFNEATGEWEFIEGTITEDGQAVFTLTHCSIYGVLVQAAPAPPATPTAAPAVAPSDEGGMGIGIIIAIVLIVLVVIALVVYLFLGKKFGWKKTGGTTGGSTPAQ